jgi:nucleoside-diphosphate-sugar epimerase
MSLTRACHGFVSVFFRQALVGRSIDLYGGGTQRRDFNYVGDVVDALLAASQLKMDAHEIYNLGHHEPHSVRDFAELLCETIGGSVRSVPFPPERKSIDIGDYWGDYEKFRRATGWRPATSLREGVARTARYYQAHSDQLLDSTIPPQSPPVMTS